MRNLAILTLVVAFGYVVSVSGFANPQAEAATVCQCVDCNCPSCDGENCSCEDDCKCGICACGKN